MNFYKENPHRNDLSPFYHLVGGYNCRIQEYEMSQNIVAPVAWMLAISIHKPSMVIEIGTDKGGLSNLISSVVATYGGEFHTMDINVGEKQNMYPLYGKSFSHQCNCFEHVDQIQRCIQLDVKCFVLCDGGDKKREFNTFSKFLKPGDVIGCHDFIDETIPNFTPDYWGCCEVQSKDLELDGLKDFMPEWFKYSAWKVCEKI